MPRAGSQGWQSRAVPARVPVSHLGHRGSPPAALGKGFCPLPADLGTCWGVGQTDGKLAAPKAQLEPGTCLESGQQLGGSSEHPLGLCWAGRGQRGLGAVADEGQGRWEVAPFPLGSSGFFPWRSSRALAVPCRERSRAEALGALLTAGFGSRARFPDVSVQAGAGRLWQGETPAVLSTQSQPGEGSWGAFSWDISALILGNIWHTAPGNPQHLLGCSPHNFRVFQGWHLPRIPLQTIPLLQ